MGKSSFMVAWGSRFVQKNHVDFFFKHYSDISNQNSNLNFLIFRILTELKLALNLRAEIPNDPSQLVGTFSAWLNALPSLFAKAVFMIDGIDSVRGVTFCNGVENEGISRLCWLPENIPPNARMVLSCSSDSEVHDVLKGRNWQMFHIQVLDKASREKLITNFVTARGLRLPSGAMDRLLKRHQAKYPLFLIQVLRGILTPEDMKPSGSMGINLFSKSINELCDIVLNNLECNPEMQVRGGLMEDFMSFIAVSRSGMSEYELLDILQTPRALFSKFYLASRQVLKVCFGLVTFSHVLFLRSIERRYLSRPEVRRSARIRIAEYFQSRPVTHRTVDELPWQLFHCRQWQDLAAAIMNPHMFTLMFGTDRGKFDLVIYWNEMLSGDFDSSDLIAKCDACQFSADELSFSPSEKVILCFNLADLLQMLGFIDASIPFLRKAAHIEETAIGLTSLMFFKSKVREARSMAVKKDFVRAQSIYESVIPALSSLLDRKASEAEFLEDVERREGLALIEQIEEDYALLLWKSKSFSKLSTICLSMLKVERGIKMQGFLILDSLLHAHIERGALEMACNLIEKCTLSIRDAPREFQIQIVSRKLGVLLLREEYHAMIVAMEGFEWIFHSENAETLDVSISTDILATYGFALCQVGRADEAINLWSKATLDDLQTSENKDEMPPKYRSSVALDNEETEPSFETWTFPSTLLEHLGAAHRQLGSFTEAESCYKRSLILKLLTCGSNDCSISYSCGEMASLHECRRSESSAIRLRKAAAKICLESSGYSSIVHFKSLLSLSTSYWKFGMFSNAEKLAGEVLEAVQGRYGSSHELIASACLVLGKVQSAIGKFSDAKENLMRANRLASSIWGLAHFESIESNAALAQLHIFSGDYDLAEAALFKNRTQREAAGGLWCVGSSRDILTLALLYFRIGAFCETESLLCQCLPGVQMVHGPNSLQVACMLTILALSYARMSSSDKHRDDHSCAMSKCEFAASSGNVATVALRAYRIRYSTFGLESRHFLQHTIFTALLLEQESVFRLAEPLFRKSIFMLNLVNSNVLAKSLYSHYDIANKNGFSSDEWRPLLKEEEFASTSNFSDPFFDALLGRLVDSVEVKGGSNTITESFETTLITRIPQRFKFLTDEDQTRIQTEEKWRSREDLSQVQPKHRRAIQGTPSLTQRHSSRAAGLVGTLKRPSTALAASESELIKISSESGAHRRPVTASLLLQARLEHVDDEVVQQWSTGMFEIHDGNDWLSDSDPEGSPSAAKDQSTKTDEQRGHAVSKNKTADDSESEIEQVDRDGDTALHCAVRVGDLEKVKNLVAEGASVNAANRLVKIM